MLGRVVKDNPMLRIAEKLGPADHRFENARLLLHPQVSLSDVGFGRDIADQTFGLMDVEIIDHEMPLGHLWGGFDRPTDVVDIVFLCSGRASRDGANVATGDLKIGDETQRTVADVLVFPPFDFTRPQR